MSALLTKDDFLNFIHAYTEAVEIDGKFEIVLRDYNFKIVIEGILKRMIEKLDLQIEVN